MDHGKHKDTHPISYNFMEFNLFNENVATWHPSRTDNVKAEQTQQKKHNFL